MGAGSSLAGHYELNSKFSGNGLYISVALTADPVPLVL